MGHSYNYGHVTSNKGLAIESVRCTFGSSGAVTLTDRGKAGFVASVAKTATGRYTFTLAPPFPVSEIAIDPKLSCIAANGAILHARYVEGSYSNSAGTFEIDVSDNAGSPAAADPTSGTSLHVIMHFQRYTNL